jgi:hypothetical protein
MEINRWRETDSLHLFCINVITNMVVFSPDIIINKEEGIVGKESTETT